MKLYASFQYLQEEPCACTIVVFSVWFSTMECRYLLLFRDTHIVSSLVGSVRGECGILSRTQHLAYFEKQLPFSSYNWLLRITLLNTCTDRGRYTKRAIRKGMLVLFRQDCRFLLSNAHTWSHYGHKHIIQPGKGT